MTPDNQYLSATRPFLFGQDFVASTDIGITELYSVDFIPSVNLPCSAQYGVRVHVFPLVLGFKDYT